ncbi:MAG: polymorphic toxin-type HINT domain-containing protein [Lachnospiraceae bacterium]|nr:polymorphic toxin-type HINT domain-containing protein [Lachnospiraceae bacterium]
MMQAACALGSLCCKCFTGDTVVATEEGFVRIEEIEEGDYVLAENVETGEQEYKKVRKVYVKEATELTHIKTDGKLDEDQNIDTTGNHPFYVEDRGWVAAAEIHEGDELHTSDGRIVTVLANTTEKLSKAITVYNLEVEDFHMLLLINI